MCGKWELYWACPSTHWRPEVYSRYYFVIGGHARWNKSNNMNWKLFFLSDLCTGTKPVKEFWRWDDIWLLFLVSSSYKSAPESLGTRYFMLFFFTHSVHLVLHITSRADISLQIGLWTGTSLSFWLSQHLEDGWGSTFPGQKLQEWPWSWRHLEGREMFTDHSFLSTPRPGASQASGQCCCGAVSAESHYTMRIILGLWWGQSELQQVSPHMGAEHRAGTASMSAASY